MISVSALQRTLMLTMTSTLVGLSSFAWAGGADVGGGNVRSSTPDQVENAVRSANKSYVIEALVREFLAPNAAFPILDKKAREMLMRINSTWSKMVFTPDPQPRGACVYQGQARDSALTIINEHFARVCFSVER